jgi:hypothetical protein
MKTVKGITDAKIDTARFMWSLRNHLGAKQVCNNHIVDILSIVAKYFYHSLSEESKEGWVGQDYAIEAITLGQENEIAYIEEMRGRVKDPMSKLLFGLLDSMDLSERSEHAAEMRRSADEAIADIRRKDAEAKAQIDKVESK